MRNVSENHETRGTDVDTEAGAASAAASPVLSLPRRKQYQSETIHSNRIYIYIQYIRIYINLNSMWLSHKCCGKCKSTQNTKVLFISYSRLSQFIQWCQICEGTRHHMHTIQSSSGAKVPTDWQISLWYIIDYIMIHHDIMIYYDHDFASTSAKSHVFNICNFARRLSMRLAACCSCHAAVVGPSPGSSSE